MKIVRIMDGVQERYGKLEGEMVTFIQGSIFGDYEITDISVPLAQVQLLAPCEPSKAVCIGLNYHDHAQEMQLTLPEEPLVFIKPSTALCDPGGVIDYPGISNNVHFEAELAIVIKKTARKIPAERACDYILGYTCANDVTARDLQLKDGQWTRGKSFDTFLPLGPCIQTDMDPHKADIRLYLNEEVMQSSNTKELIFSVPQIVAFVTQAMTLLPGDVILTGTPSGVGPMQIGDRVAVEIAGIGRLENVVGKL